MSFGSNLHISGKIAVVPEEQEYGFVPSETVSIPPDPAILLLQQVLRNQQQILHRLDNFDLRLKNLEHLTQSQSLGALESKGWFSKNLSLVGFELSFGTKMLGTHHDVKIPLLVKGPKKSVTFTLKWEGELNELKENKSLITDKIRSQAAIYLKQYHKTAKIFNKYIGKDSVTVLIKNDHLTCTMECGDSIPLSFHNKAFICFGLATEGGTDPEFMLLEDVVAISKMPSGEDQLKSGVGHLMRNKKFYTEAWWCNELEALSEEQAEDLSQEFEESSELNQVRPRKRPRTEEKEVKVEEARSEPLPLQSFSTFTAPATAPGPFAYSYPAETQPLIFPPFDPNSPLQPSEGFAPLSFEDTFY